MGGFANLKKDFEYAVERETFSNEEIDGQAAVSRENEFRYLLCRCLFEIAGNLDTIAVEMRNQSKIAEGLAASQWELVKIQDTYVNGADIGA